ncbi:MAG TPA: MFS transporter [Burkholderiaceae bacterium]|nr:MFS transporter [Burkholderiaceae bacterium]
MKLAFLAPGGLTRHISLPSDDLLRDAMYRRLWLSILISSFGAQVTMLAVPLTAAVLLHATPTQMGTLTALEVVPFVLFSLPAGVWLDRVRKLPVVIAGELLIAAAAASVPLGWWFEVLTMHWLYAVALLLGTVYTIAGSAAQIVLTQVVERHRLVEAHAKNALASSAAEVLGPGAAGALIKITGAPLALLADALLLLASALILRGIRVNEALRERAPQFLPAMRIGINFVVRNRLLVTMALLAGGWQFCHHTALVVQILFATRELGLSEGEIGLCFVGLGIGTIFASAVGNRISQRIGPGPALVLGVAVSAAGWLLGGLAPLSTLGIAQFAAMLMLFGVGAVLIFINFLALRQALTPAHLLGRMTATMRWLILLPAGPGALLGGWLGEHFGLRASLLCAGICGLVFAALAWRRSLLRDIDRLPAISDESEMTPAVAWDEGRRLAEPETWS